MSLLQTVEEPKLVLVGEIQQPCIPVILKPQQEKESALPCALIQSTEFDSTAADDEFVPGAMCKCVHCIGVCNGCFKYLLNCVTYFFNKLFEKAYQIIQYTIHYFCFCYFFLHMISKNIELGWGWRGSQVTSILVT